MNSADTSKWVTLRNSELIKDKVLEIGDGYRAKNNEMDSEGLPFARAGNIKDGFQFLNADILGKKSVVKAGNKVAKINDVVLTTKGTFGRVALVRQNTEKFVYSPQLCYWRVKNYSVIHPRFLYYWIQGPEFLTQAHQVKSSTDMADYTNLKDQRAMSITAPTIDIQEKIAAILSAYDDLIENNKRRIALLEKMAEEIYREWFVRMRFPGYKNAKFVKGVPANWTIKNIGAICKRVTDGSHLSPEFHPNGKYMASVKDMQSYGFTFRSIKTISDQDFQKLVKADCKPLKYDVLIAKDGSYLKHVFVWNHNYDIVILSSIAILRPNIDSVLPYFLSLVLKQNSTKSMMSGYVSGSALPRIILKDFMKMKLLIPEFDLIEQFESIAEPLFYKINILCRQIEKLEITRDKLLSRLVSGKLPVESLDIQFPPSMQTEQENAHA